MKSLFSSAITKTIVLAFVVALGAGKAQAFCKAGSNIMKIGESPTYLGAKYYSWKMEGDFRVNVEVTNPDSQHFLGRPVLTVITGTGREIKLSKNFGPAFVKPMDTQTFFFNGPEGFLSNVRQAKVLYEKFACFPTEFKFVPIPVKTTEAEKKAKGRKDEIYDNCIIDLMPDKTNQTKEISIMEKCERISKNPSWLEKLKY